LRSDSVSLVPSAASAKVAAAGSCGNGVRRIPLRQAEHTGPARPTKEVRTDGADDDRQELRIVPPAHFERATRPL
jgi:hypothetical protein